jgi:alanine dehydrogenase
MRIGIPRESKPGERRVALLPGAVAALVAGGHEVRVACGAGEGAGEDDAAYAAAGARLVADREAWEADLVVKVKEIQPAERDRLVPGCALFAFQHLVGEPALARALAARGITAIAFEMVRDAAGGFPLLAPMSVLAGRLAILAGAHHLTVPGGGRGVLLAGGAGADPARVLVLGGGHAGTHAAEVAASLGARVTLLTRSASTRDALASRFGGRVALGLATPQAVEAEAPAADLIVGAVFVPGEPTPRLLPRALVARMRPGSVIVDVSIDAGGVAETSRPTTHDDPVFVADGVVHYGVPNMPAAVPRAGSEALSAAVAPYALALANGIPAAARRDTGLAAGILLWKGRITQAGLAAESGLAPAPLTAADLAP